MTSNYFDMHWFTAFTIGLVGSMHCVGMCGPLSMAVGGRSPRPWLAGTLYNLGRTITYALTGAVIGLIGKGIFLAGMQKSLSIGLGVAMLLAALFSVNVESRLLRVSVFSRWFLWLKSTAGSFIAGSTVVAPLLVGLVNGLLPCGLVYMAMLGALSTGTVAAGMLYMAMFGLGTLPMMLGLSMAGGLAPRRLRAYFQRSYPVLLVFFALLFLYRGLNFHLPGEFFFQEKMREVPMCH